MTKRYLSKKEICNIAVAGSDVERLVREINGESIFNYNFYHEVQKDKRAKRRERVIAERRARRACQQI